MNLHIASRLGRCIGPLFTVLLFLLLTACGSTSPEPAAPAPAARFDLNSPVFSQAEAISPRHSCDGEDISPPLQWGDPPAGTQSLVLICDDPDAPGGTWVHWLLYNIPADSRALDENVAPEETLPDGSRQGKNSWGRTSYGGPCPPSGTHRYFFRLYALDTVLELPTRVDKESLLEAMEGHILGQAELMGTYTRE
jgi:Raf kinase inhibitor-like YbhB/YbcL family protein